eukprot:tig00020848_g14612.t1
MIRVVGAKQRPAAPSWRNYGTFTRTAESISVQDLAVRFEHQSPSNLSDLSTPDIQAILSFLQSGEERSQLSALNSLNAALKRAWNAQVIWSWPQVTKLLVTLTCSKSTEVAKLAASALSRALVFDGNRRIFATCENGMRQLVDMLRPQQFPDPKDMISILAAITNACAFETNRKALHECHGMQRLATLLQVYEIDVSVLTAILGAITNGAQYEANAAEFLKLTSDPFRMVLNLLRPSAGDPRTLIAGLNVVANLLLLPESDGLMEDKAGELQERIRGILPNADLRVRASVLQVHACLRTRPARGRPWRLHIWGEDEEAGRGPWLAQLLDEVAEQRDAGLVPWVCHDVPGVPEHPMWDEAWPWVALDKACHMLGRQRQRMLGTAVARVLDRRGSLESTHN